MKNIVFIAGIRLASATIPAWTAPGPNDGRFRYSPPFVPRSPPS